MKKYSLIISILFLLSATAAHAQSLTRYLSIPSSGFTPQSSEGFFIDDGSYNGNTTGTARFFGGSFNMFAPVNLPHGMKVTSLHCGGGTSPIARLRFTLRRNEPQQANVDMAVIQLSGEESGGFKFMETNSITSPVVNNFSFNYYIVASANDGDVAPCTNCSVGSCRIGYAPNAVVSDPFPNPVEPSIDPRL